jgi:hypothetical protein
MTTSFEIRVDGKIILKWYSINYLGESGDRIDIA